jgi:hypothetical protein
MLCSVFLLLSFYSFSQLFGSVVAQALSRQRLSSAAGVPSQVRSCGICGGQNGTGKGFLRVPQFPLLILIPPTDPHSLIILSFYRIFEFRIKARMSPSGHFIYTIFWGMESCSLLDAYRRFGGT